MRLACQLEETTGSLATIQVRGRVQPQLVTACTPEMGVTVA